MKKQISLKQEFENAFDEYSDALFRHSCFRLSDHERARDLVQDAFMKAWDYARKEKSIKNWRALLYRILNNLIIDEYRKKKSTSLDALLEEDGVTEAHFDDLVVGGLQEEEARVDNLMKVEVLQEVLKELSAQERDIITVRIIDEMSVRETAEILKISIGSVHVRLHRALTKVKKILHEKNH